MVLVFDKPNHGIEEGHSEREPRLKIRLCLSYPHSGLLLLVVLSVTRSRVVREKVRRLPHGDIAMYLR